MGRAPCCDKTKVKRGPWSPEEDSILKNYIHQHGTGGNWIALPHKAGLKRCGKSCRLRWLNYLRPDIKLGGFTEEEDNIILTLYNNIGSRWSVIASHLRGRTDNDVKNHWNTKLKKKLTLAPKTTMMTTTTTTTTTMTSLPIVDYPITDYYSTTSVLSSCNSTIMDYQRTLFSNMGQGHDISFMDHSTSNSFNTVSSSQENRVLSPSSFSMGNEYTSWSSNDGGGAIGSNAGLPLDEFDIQQVIGEVDHLANSNYSTQGLYHSF